MDKIIQVSQKHNVIGIHLFTRETFNNSTAHCRNFAPLYEIPEESATGTSNGALACYIWKYDKLKGNQIYNMVFEQGYCMNKPSEIISKLEVAKDNIAAVKIGGRALLRNELQVNRLSF
jgi:PhzF family phenazine biosynthesis protein